MTQYDDDRTRGLFDLGREAFDVLREGFCDSRRPKRVEFFVVKEQSREPRESKYAPKKPAQQMEMNLKHDLKEELLLLVECFDNLERARESLSRPYRTIDSIKTGLISVERELGQLRSKWNNLEPKKEGLSQRLGIISDPLSSLIDSLGKIARENTVEATTLESLKSDFLELLKQVGVEPFSSLNETFDGNKHQCIGFEDRIAENFEDQVIREERCGFTMNGEVFRLAYVIVAK